MKTKPWRLCLDKKRITEEQKSIIKIGVEKMKEENAPNWIIDDYVYDMYIQFEEENKIKCQH